MEIPKFEIVDPDRKFAELMVELLQSISNSSDFIFAVVAKRGLDKHCYFHLRRLERNMVFSTPIFLGEDIYFTPRELSRIHVEIPLLNSLRFDSSEFERHGIKFIEANDPKLVAYGLLYLSVSNMTRLEDELKLRVIGYQNRSTEGEYLLEINRYWSNKSRAVQLAAFLLWFNCISNHYLQNSSKLMEFIDMMELEKIKDTLLIDSILAHMFGFATGSYSFEFRSKEFMKKLPLIYENAGSLGRFVVEYFNSLPKIEEGYEWEEIKYMMERDEDEEEWDD